MTFDSRRHDVTSIEHYVDQSWLLFIRDVSRQRGQISRAISSSVNDLKQLLD